MKTLYLHGFLKEKYGASFELDVATPAEAVRALAVQLPGFEDDVKAGNWHVLRGPLDQEEAMDAEGITVTLGREKEIHLMPAVEGAGNGGLMAVLGVILIVAGYFTMGASVNIGIAMMAGGAGMALGGIIQMTMKLPGADSSVQESVDARASFLFNGPTNTSSQGVAVPRGYGRVRVGSVVASAALYSEELAS
jgi:predicted phage tail protein